MNIEELGKKCKEEKCNRCLYRNECEKMGEMLEGISPKELLTILQDEIECEE